MGPKSIGALIAIAIAVVVCVVFYTQLFYTVDAAEIAVFQAPVSGTLTVHRNPGTYLRYGSTVTEYKKRDLFRFDGDRAIQVRFNDGGHAVVAGNVSWEMPASDEMVIKLHTFFRSQENVDQQLVKNAIIQSLYNTSPSMSSTESYAARRTEFLRLFADQLENGVYKIETVDTKAPDPITGEMKTIKVVNIVKDAKGEPVVAEASQMKEFGINILPPTISQIAYDPEVEKQIQQQRDNIMAIQTAQAQAKKAEQAKLTAAANGEAEAMKARWEQEVDKARAVTKAEQEKAVAETKANQDKNVAETKAKQLLDVAQLDAQAADQEKTAAIRRGEGQAQARQLVLNADGALSAKLEALVQINRTWADAMANSKNALVPQVIMGGSGSGAQTAGVTMQDFMTVLTANAAKGLALDLGVTGAQRK